MKEFSEGGEQHPDKKKINPQRRRESDKSLNEVLFKKKVPIQVSPESVFRLSFAHANDLAEHPYSGKVDSSTIVGFAKIAQHNEDLETVRHWTQRLESQMAIEQSPSEGLSDTDFARENNLARIYFIGATLGDAEALTKLDTMLTDERDTYDDEEKSFHEFFLTDIVMEAALAGIPADIWINRFAKNRTHALQLQSHYAFSTQETNSAGKPIAQRYTNEITKALFQEETPDELFWYHALNIMKNDDNQSKQSALVKEASRVHPIR